MTQIFNRGEARDAFAIFDSDPWFQSAAAQISGWKDIVAQAERLERAEGLLKEPDGRGPDQGAWAARLLDEDDVDHFAEAREAVDLEARRRAHDLIFGASRTAAGMLAARARAWAESHTAELLESLHAERVQTAAKIRTFDVSDGLPSTWQTLKQLVEEWRLHVRRHRAFLRWDERRFTTPHESRIPWPDHDWAADYTEGWPDFWRFTSAIADDRTELGDQPEPWSTVSIADVTATLQRFKVIWTPTRSELDRADEQLTRTLSRLSRAAIDEYNERARKGFPGKPPRLITETWIEPPADVEPRELAGSSRVGPAQ